uniref:SP-RING-type domain-containing protein n=1 Tax=Macrostomum lignano TaxID=282301 RepID=A0A1I8JQR1_9PLAT
MSTVPAVSGALRELQRRSVGSTHVDKAAAPGGSGARANSRLFSLRAYAEPEGRRDLTPESLLVSLNAGRLVALAPAARCASSCRDRRLHRRPEDETLLSFRPAARDSAPGWSCPKCTFRNEPVRSARLPDVAVGAGRSDYYEVPAELQAEEEQRQLKLHGEFLKNSSPVHRYPKYLKIHLFTGVLISDDHVLHQVSYICDHVFTDASGRRERNFRELMNLTQGSLIPVPAPAGLRVPDLLCDVGGDDDDGDGIRGLRLRDNTGRTTTLRRRAENDENAKLGLQKL